MKQHRRGSREPLSIDPDSIETLYGNESRKPSSNHQAERKTQQFCRQVQRALNLALADCGVDGLFIEDVSPAPDCGRLLVYFAVPAGYPVLEAIAALGRESLRLRAEVAATISRKRAPELHFVPAFPEGGCDE